MTSIDPPRKGNPHISYDENETYIPRRFTFVLFENPEDDPISLHTLKKSLTTCLHPHDRLISFIREIELDTEEIEFIPIPGHEDSNIHEVSEHSGHPYGGLTVEED